MLLLFGLKFEDLQDYQLFNRRICKKLIRIKIVIKWFCKKKNIEKVFGLFASNRIKSNQSKSRSKVKGEKISCSLHEMLMSVECCKGMIQRSN